MIWKHAPPCRKMTNLVILPTKLKHESHSDWTNRSLRLIVEQLNQNTVQGFHTSRSISGEMSGGLGGVWSGELFGRRLYPARWTPHSLNITGGGVSSGSGPTTIVLTMPIEYTDLLMRATFVGAQMWLGPGTDRLEAISATVLTNGTLQVTVEGGGVGLTVYFSVHIELQSVDVPTAVMQGGGAMSANRDEETPGENDDDGDDMPALVEAPIRAEAATTTTAAARSGWRDRYVTSSEGTTAVFHDDVGPIVDDGPFDIVAMTYGSPTTRNGIEVDPVTGCPHSVASMEYEQFTDAEGTLWLRRMMEGGSVIFSKWATLAMSDHGGASIMECLAKMVTAGWVRAGPKWIASIPGSRVSVLTEPRSTDAQGVRLRFFQTLGLNL